MAAEDRVKSGSGILTGSLLLASCWCVTALAASSSADIGCGTSTGHLQSLQVSVDSLSVSSVDHIAGGPEPVTLPADSTEAVSKAAAPILYLAPHIAAMFNYVFDGAETSETPNIASDVSEIPTDDRTTRSSGEEDRASTPMNAVIPDNGIARFQRQMYRKDI